MTSARSFEISVAFPYESRLDLIHRFTGHVMVDGEEIRNGRFVAGS